MDGQGELVLYYILSSDYPGSFPVQDGEVQVSNVVYDGGELVQIGGGAWIDIDDATGEIVYFSQISRDEWSVYLVSEDEAIDVQVDLYSGTINVDQHDGQGSVFFSDILSSDGPTP